MHWIVRSMAKASGLSPSSVQRIWKAHGLKPHLTRTFWPAVCAEGRCGSHQCAAPGITFALSGVENPAVISMFGRVGLVLTLPSDIACNQAGLAPHFRLLRHPARVSASRSAGRLIVASWA
jgi:hypothetical protein